MSNASNLSNLANVLDDGTSGQVLTSQGSGGVAFADATGGSSVTTVTNVSGASDSLTAISSPSVGDIVFVTSTNGLFIRKSNGWFKIADVTNLQPTGLTGVSNSALAIDGTPTTITLAATDPEGLALTFSAAAKTGSNTTFSEALTDGNTVNAYNGSTIIATVAQNSNVFTIDPNTANNAGTVDITFSVTDGINTALTADGQFTLTFITTVTNSKYTTLLVTATGTSDNSYITDSSYPNSSYISVNGDTHVGTFSPYRSGGYSTSFDGTNDYLQTASSDFYLSTSQFSVEVWIKPSDLSGNKVILQADQGSSYQLYTFSTQVKWYTNTAHVGNAGVDILSVGKWTHLLITRDSNNTLRIFADGILLHVTTNHTYDYGTNNTIFELGYNGSNRFAGEIRDARVISGSIPSEYQTSSTTTTSTSAVITVPTEPLTAVSGTKFLGGHLPYLGYTTASTTGYFNIIGGNPSTRPFSPYDYTEYSATDHGGSVYFDGNGDDLRIGNTISLSGDFTVSAWIYMQGSAKGVVVGSDMVSVNNQFYIDQNNIIGFYDHSNVRNGTGGIQRNTWNYCVWSRSGSTVSMYVNGVSMGTGASSATFSLKVVGGLGTAGSLLDPMNGYISDLQIKSSPTSAANAVPPTAPLSSSGTVIHIKDTDASIIDKSQNGNIKIINNTTGSSTNKGGNWANTYSIYFDGAQDGLVMPINQTIGTGDFTIEAFVKLIPDGSNSYGIFQSHTSSTVSYSSSYTNSIGFYLTAFDNNPRALCVSGYDGASTYGTGYAPLSYYENNWRHIAVAREGTNLRIYVEGNLVRTHTNSNSISPTYLGVGGFYDDTNSFKGNISDGRLTVGKARYTAADETANIPSAPLEG